VYFPVRIDVPAGEAHSLDSGVRMDTKFSNFERYIGSDGEDTLIGGAGKDNFDGGAPTPPEEEEKDTTDYAGNVEDGDCADAMGCP